MADCTKVILLYDDDTAKVYDPKDIDSIFFDDKLAKCFAKHCLEDPGDPPDGPGKSEKALNDAIGDRGDGHSDGGSSGGGENPGDPTHEATLTSTAVATAETTTVAAASPPCIHMRDCTWDCGTTTSVY